MFSVSKDYFQIRDCNLNKNSGTFRYPVARKYNRLRTDKRKMLYTKRLFGAKIDKNFIFLR